MIGNLEITDSQGVKIYYSYTRHKWVVLVVLVILVLAMAFISINAGASSISLLSVLRALVGLETRRTSNIIWHIRLPRVAAAIVAGAGFGVTGCVMQNNLKNPLASPSTLGITHAAAFGANIAIILLNAGTALYTASGEIIINNPYLVTTCAFCFSMGAAFLILTLGKIKGFSPEAVVLAGIALGSLFTAGITIIQYFATDIQITAAIFWTFGDLSRVTWKEIHLITVVVILPSIYFFTKRWDYNALDHGEDVARSLGVNVARSRFYGLLLSSLITAVTVSFMGIIAFIGLIAPHIMRRFVGTDHRFLIPASMLCGSFLLLTADTLARTVISPVVLPVGAFTSLLGAPMFIYLLLKGYKRK
ncbi:MAG: FecCD family ABC transporter permease [Oscillospiraceae bacterium]|jgi:iron complex transport system permease protein